MLTNLLSMLDKNADLLWLVGLLLALAFRRNRYALTLAALGVGIWGPAEHPGLSLTSAALVLSISVLAEPGLWSPRGVAFAGAAIALPLLPTAAPAVVSTLDQYAAQPLTLSLGLGWSSWVVAIAASWALLRWLQRAWPLDLYLAVSLVPAVVAMSLHPPHSTRAWLGATAGAIIIATLYGAYRMAFIDALTGLPNRRALDERLARSSGRIAVGMADVDHFKRFNDRYGHEAGDRVLRSVARELRRCRGGSAYRYGGEEFAIVFEGRQVERAGASLENVRAGVEAVRVRLNRSTGGSRAQAVRRGQHAGEVSVTISIGVAERDPERRTSSAVVDAADKALYRSKQRGRNRLTLAGAARSN